MQQRCEADLVESGTGKKAPRCQEYIMVHEMVHLLERLHNATVFIP